MKKLLVFSSELLAFIGLGFLIGRILDKQLAMEGWGMILGIFLAYVLWFFNFYKSSRRLKRLKKEREPS